MTFIGVTRKHPSEHVEQVAFVDWFRRAYPGVLIYAIPNGGARSAMTGAKLKLEGVVAGMPDLHIPAWRAWIEMKRVGGAGATQVQKAMHRRLEVGGDVVILAHGAQAARAAILGLRATQIKTPEDNPCTNTLQVL